MHPNDLVSVLYFHPVLHAIPFFLHSIFHWENNLGRGQKYNNWSISCIHDFKVCPNFWFLTYPKSAIMMGRQLRTVCQRVNYLLAHTGPLRIILGFLFGWFGVFWVLLVWGVFLFCFFYNQDFLLFSKVSLITWPAQKNRFFFLSLFSLQQALLTK